MDYSISKHAMERYVERIQDYDDSINMASYITIKEGEIKERIKKLIEYANLIYVGKSASKYNKELVQVYLNKEGWAIIIDAKNKTVVTLFKITLGLDDELDKQYLEKVLIKIEEIEARRIEKLNSITKTYNDYMEIVQDLDSQINALRSDLNNLEKTKEGYLEVMNNVHLEEEIANKELKDFVAKILGRKVF